MKKLIIGIYIFLLFFVVYFSYAFVDPNLIYLNQIYSGFYAESRELTTFLYLLSIFGLFAWYILFLLLTKRQIFNTQHILILIAITIAILLFSYPAMLSFDIFNYLTTAKVLFFYKENPYVIMPIEFLGEPYLQFTHAANKIALYGPVWIVLAGVPFLLGFGNFLLTLFNFKLFIVFFYILEIFLIWKLTKNILSVAIFSLNPLVIFETLISSHNDIVMMSFVLLSYYFLTKKKLLVSIIFFIFSVFIKYATVLLLPVFLFAVWKIVRGNKIAWNKIFYYSALLMIVAFSLSPFREEIYPWYAIWFLSFVTLIPEKKNLLYISLIFSFSLMLRYAPFMYAGTHFGDTPLLKILLTFIPPIIIVVVYSIRLIWLRSVSR